MVFVLEILATWEAKAFKDKRAFFLRQWGNNSQFR
jgi:hypothetical protein